VPLPKIFRTSSFRLTLLYSGFFLFCCLVLFLVFYWAAADSMARQIDNSVASEIGEIKADAKTQDIDSLKSTVDLLAKTSADFSYLLQDRDGHRLAGNLPAMTPTLGISEQPNQMDPDEGKTLRGRGVRLPNDVFLFVALSTYQMHQMRQAMVKAFLWGMLVTLVLSLIGGTFMSLSILGRVEALSRASREIVDSDMKRRIPLRGSNDEFDHLVVSLNAMLDRITGLMDGIRQVSSDIAHDLRTPLTRLRQRVEVTLHREQDVFSLRLGYEKTLRDIDSILEIFDALLRISRLESTSPATQFQPVDLTEVLLTAVEVYMPITEEKHQILTEIVAPGLTVVGDRQLLLQLFANVIENALRHTPVMTEIQVRGLSTDDAIRVTVEDNGPGIPETQHDLVFRRFFRCDPARRGPGSGLGLSLVAAIAACHNCKVTLADTAPGLRVTFEFPRMTRT
jgi:signal transduction histidine kinase